MIPKYFVAGLFTPPGPSVTREALNRVWLDVTARYPYQQLQFAPNGDGAMFLATTPEDAFTVHPPLLQLRETVAITPEFIADKAETLFKLTAKQLGATQFFNLGVKHVYHVPAPSNDAHDFLLRKVLKKESQELAMLQMGGSLWGGVKYVAQQADGVTYTLVVEPFVADPKFIFLDLDSQFPGEIPLDKVRERAAEAGDYVETTVKRYLEDCERG